MEATKQGKAEDVRTDGLFGWKSMYQDFFRRDIDHLLTPLSRLSMPNTPHTLLNSIIGGIVPLPEILNVARAVFGRDREVWCFIDRSNRLRSSRSVENGPYVARYNPSPEENILACCSADMVRQSGFTTATLDEILLVLLKSYRESTPAIIDGGRRVLCAETTVVPIVNANPVAVSRKENKIIIDVVHSETFRAMDTAPLLVYPSFLGKKETKYVIW